MHPLSASRRGDLDAACAMRFEAIFDEPLHAWAWRSSPRLGQGFIACAIRRTQLEELQAALGNQRLELVSARGPVSGLVEPLAKGLKWSVSAGLAGHLYCT